MKVQNVSLSEPFPFSKKLRPLIPKLSVFDYCEAPGRNPSPETSHPTGTRWNPTRDQVSFLEALYKGGMRNPNATQIESIAKRLEKLGKIEGKNVFYWFQNHKARERQRQRRTSAAADIGRSATKGGGQAGKEICGRGEESVEMVDGGGSSASSVLKEGDHQDQFDHLSYRKGECTSWVCQIFDADSSGGKTVDDQKQEVITLELFPLLPESR